MGDTPSDLEIIIAAISAATDAASVAANAVINSKLVAVTQLEIKILKAT